MRPISPEVLEKLQSEKEICALKDENCSGRITYEHCLTYGGKQIDEAWAIVKLCEWHHSVNKYQDGGGLNKEKNVWVALNKATDDELLKYSKCINYLKLKERLNHKYGAYKN